MSEQALSRRHRVVKRALDLVVAGIGLVVSAPVLLPALAIATIETRRSGLFRQIRVGRDGELFQLLKVRTMRDDAPGVRTTVTTRADQRITRSGRLFRRLKIDELPQLVNVLRGEMSLVGPRPDVPGYADRLEGDDRRILTVRPGITGPAAIAYRDEEELLAAVDDPEVYNSEVIWPDKVRINLEYVDNYSLLADVDCLTETVRSVLRRGGESR